MSDLGQRASEGGLAKGDADPLGGAVARATFEHALDAMLLADDHRRYTDANPAACALLGLSRAEVLSRRVDDFVSEDARPSLDGAWRDFLETGSQSGEIELVTSDGSRRTVEFRATARIMPGCHLSVLRDLTDRGAKEESRRLGSEFDFLAKVLEHSAAGLQVVDEQRCIRFMSPAGARLLGYDSPSDLLGLPVHETIHYKRPDGTPFPVAECSHLSVFETGQAVRGEDHFVRRDGSMLPVAYSTSPMPLAGGQGAVVAFQDLRERERADEQLAHRMLHDPLTGLASRQLLLDRLAQSLARQSRLGGAMAVLYLDLDDFKSINDAYGHDVGDEVLVAVARRLRDSLRGKDTIARSTTTNESAFSSPHTVGRLGGNEFVVILEDLVDLADGAAVAERIRAESSAPS